MTGWRVWLAFEVRPGITITSLQDRSAYYRGLADTCRRSDGKIDSAEYDLWLDLVIDHAHLWGYA